MVSTRRRHSSERAAQTPAAKQSSSRAAPRTTRTVAKRKGKHEASVEESVLAFNHCGNDSDEDLNELSTLINVQYKEISFGEQSAAETKNEEEEEIFEDVKTFNDTPKTPARNGTKTPAKSSRKSTRKLVSEASPVLHHGDDADDAEEKTTQEDFYQEPEANTQSSNSTVAKADKLEATNSTSDKEVSSMEVVSSSSEDSDSEDEGQKRGEFDELAVKSLKRAGFRMQGSRRKEDEMDGDNEDSDAERYSKWDKTQSDHVAEENDLPTTLNTKVSVSDISTLEKRETGKLISGKKTPAVAKQQQMQLAKRSGLLKEWFEMKTPEMTPELEKELKVLRMRGYLDPKRFYKANDSAKGPAAFQIGTIEVGFGDRAGNLTRKERKATFMDQVLGDQKSQEYTKRAYAEIQDDRRNLWRIKGKKRQKKSYPSSRK